MSGLRLLAAFLASLACACAARPGEPAPECARELGGELHVEDETRERVVPLRLLRATDASVRVAYSSSWAETNVVELGLVEGRLEVRARLETDYGSFELAPDPERSSSHAHGDSICIDLAVRRPSGTQPAERWRARIRVPELARALCAHAASAGPTRPADAVRLSGPRG